jgi:hypothetical protein
MERKTYISLVRMILWYRVKQCGVRVVPWRNTMAEVDLAVEGCEACMHRDGKEFFQVALSRQISTPQLLLSEHQRTPALPRW